MCITSYALLCRFTSFASIASSILGALSLLHAVYFWELFASVYKLAKLGQSDSQ